MENLFEIFNEIEDPRDNRGKKHKLIHVIILAIYGILCGFEDFTNMSYFLKKREKELIETFDLLNGVPSHDTFSAVFRILDPKKFMELFIEWTKRLVVNKVNKDGKHIAIDGKAVKSATDKANNGNIPYIVSAFLTDIGISIGQCKVDDKSNEITAIPDLLNLITIEDATITIDAIGTQTKIVDTIISKKGHYCLSVKENQKVLYQDIHDYFAYAIEDDEEKENITSYETIEKGHGRIEKRRYYVSKRVDFINDKNKWKNLSSIGYVIQQRTINGSTSIEYHYYIMDKVLNASEFAKFTRNHWQIENNLHWVLDVIFNEDHSTAKTGNSIENISIIRKMVFNLTKLDPEMSKKTTKKKMIDYMYDLSLFERLIFEVLPAAQNE